MAQSGALSVLTIATLRGGRNGADPPDALPEVQCVAAFNVDWYRATLARKRGGSDAINLTGGTNWTGTLSSMFRHVPGAIEGASELWAVDDEATPLVKRLTGGTSWANVTLDDNISGSAQEVNWCSFNGKLFMAYDSAVDRTHVWDPDVSKVRRMGLGVPPAPTGALAAGAVTDTRTYKVAWTRQVGGVTVRRSELSAALSQTMAAQQTTITRGTAPGEGETHWELYVASTDGIYVLLATTVIATTTAVDNNASLATFTTLAPTVGINTVFPSTRYLSTDGNRLLGAGSWETGVQNSRVWFTPVLGDNNIGDDERYVNSVSRKNYVDLNENDGGYITGLSLPLEGSIYVFKYRQIHKLVPTGELTTPYLPYLVSKTVGCIAHKTIQLGEDQNGHPCLYFMSAMGPYRIGDNGLERVGMDLDDLWAGMNLEATTVVAHAIWYNEQAKRQYWVWFASGTSNVPDSQAVFHSESGTPTAQGIRGGWSVYTGALASSRASCLFSSTLGATMSKALKPYVAQETANSMYKADTTATSDNTIPFQAYVVTRPYTLGGEAQRFTVHYPTLTAEVSSGVTITVTISRDYGLETKSGTVSLTAAGSETRVRRKAEGAALAGCQAVQFQIGDASAVANSWKLDRLMVPYDVEASA